MRSPFVIWLLSYQKAFMISSVSALLAACVMMEFMIWQFSLYDRVGPNRPEKRAAVASEQKSVTVFKPITRLADTDYDSFGLVGNAEEKALLTDADWELVRSVRVVVGLRKMAATHIPPNDESDHELRAAFAPLVAYADKLAKQNREQEASEESKDAISKDMGNSG